MSRNYDALTESWVIVDGLPIHYWQSANQQLERPAVIHLHGFAISGTYLLPTANLLAKDYLTFVPDLPGFGRSVHPEKTLGMSELGESVVKFMDALAIERASFIGNSMGCITAVEVARIAPERVERLILVSPAGGPHNRPIFRGVAQLALDGLREPPSMFLIAPVDYLRYGLINAGRLFWSMIHYPTVDRMAHVAAPTLAILGERDPLVKEERFVRGAAENEHISLVRINGAAHAINYSHPEKLTALLRQFMSGEPLADDPTAEGTAVILKQA